MTARANAVKLVAVVDDDESVRSALVSALQSAGLHARGFDSAESFIGFGPLSEVACIITDLKMPGMSGLELQATVRRDGYAIPIVFMSAHSTPGVRSEALAAGAIAFFDKPFDDRALLETVRGAIERSAH